MSLLLNKNGLTGPFPVEWTTLTSLEVLYLHDNQLSGSLPSEIGLLSRLDQLNLSKCLRLDSKDARDGFWLVPRFSSSLN